jgi:hypothetical protein
LHLSRVGTPLIFVIHGGANSIADQAADRRAGDTGGELRRHIAADRRTEEPPAMAPTAVPVFSLAPWPVSGVAAHAPRLPAISKAQTNLVGDIASPITDLRGSARRSFPSAAVCPARRSAKSQESGESTANQQIQRVAAGNLARKTY